MGFFSRLFNLEDKSAAAKQDARDSELTIDAKTAAAVLAEIDIDTAISAHENWKLRLRNYLDGKSTEQLSPEVVCLDDKCDLGKWLHGPGGQRLGKYPAFTMLIARHK
jgi:Chemoreceptor zinc-binding domain